MNWKNTNNEKPTNGQQVLVLDSDLEYYIARFERGKFMVEHGDISLETAIQSWMPLPKKPR